MVTRIVLFGAAVGVMYLFGVSAHAQYYPPRPLPPRPPEIIEEDGPPVVWGQIVPNCRIVRETQHDDILNTNNYVEREECD